jgi:hypothetical protein
MFVNARFPKIFYHIQIGINSGIPFTNEIFSINYFLILDGAYIYA